MKIASLKADIFCRKKARSRLIGYKRIPYFHPRSKFCLICVSFVCDSIQFCLIYFNFIKLKQRQCWWRLSQFYLIDLIGFVQTLFQKNNEKNSFVLLEVFFTFFQIFHRRFCSTMYHTVKRTAEWALWRVTNIWTLRLARTNCTKPEYWAGAWKW